MDTKQEEINKISGFYKFRKKYPGLAMLITAITIFGTIFTTANLWFGVQVRPAWHWEYESLRTDIIELKIEQLDMERMILSRDLARFESLRDGFIQRGEIVPDWLDEEIATLKSRIARVTDHIKRQNHQIITSN